MAWNESPRPFIWTVTVDGIIKRIDQARQKLEAIKPRASENRGFEHAWLFKDIA